jgi:probable HAF family extracellular repeat protein
MRSASDLVRQKLPFAARAMAATAGLTLASSAGAQTFTGLGGLAGGTFTIGTGLSNNGAVVVGDADSAAAGGHSHAFRWTNSGGLQDLGSIPGGDYSYAYGTSADGSVVVGYGGASGTANANRAFRWSSADGMVNLGIMNPGETSIASAVSDDGSVVVGKSATPTSGRAFRWTQATGLVSLGTLPGGHYSEAYGITPDGSVIVGYSEISQGIQTGYRGFRWTSAGGMQSLGWLNGWDTEAWAISANGLVVVGYGGSAGGHLRATRWTTATGQVDLGILSGEVYSYAFATNHDGSIIVGGSGHGVDTGGSVLSPVNRAFLWTPTGGMIDLNEYLPTLGIDLSGWVLRNAEGMTPDGRTIAGDGEHNGIREAWIATVPVTCYANCDGSTAAPALNVADFSCFLQKYAAADPYANCDGSTAAPVLNVADFSCFLQRFAAGCS